MNQPHTFPSFAGSRRFEPFAFPSQSPSYRHRWLPPMASFPNSPPYPPLDLHSPTPISNTLETLSLKSPPCPQCKGQKYNFTAYFHNTSIFPTPPHNLLHLIEKSYVLRDRLKSFLVSYAMHEIEADQVRHVEEEINAWQHEIVLMVKGIICTAEFELDFAPLEKAKLWSFGKAQTLREHIWGVRRWELPSGDLSVLMREFRLLWEGVWVGFVRDQRDGWGESSQGGGFGGGLEMHGRFEGQFAS